MESQTLKMDKEVLNSRFNSIKINHEFSKFKEKIKKKKVIIQSLLFSKKKFDIKSARKWAKEKGYKLNKIDNPKDGKFIHLTQKEAGRFNSFKTMILGEGIKARIAANSISKFVGQIILTDFSKFSDAIKSDLDITIPMRVELAILCEGQNRDGFIKRDDLEESLEKWSNLPIIDFHDKSKDPTDHKISDRKGYTFGKPYLKLKNGDMWIVTPGEIINRDLAYQAYIMEKRGKSLEVSAEFGWNRIYDQGKVYQTNIRPHIISIVDKGHIEGNKMAIMA